MHSVNIKQCEMGQEDVRTIEMCKSSLDSSRHHPLALFVFLV